MENKKLFRINLQLFAEGSGGEGGANGTSGVNGVPAPQPAESGSVQPNGDRLANGSNGVQPDRNAEFEKLIKGEYKDLYDSRVQDIVQKRLKGMQATKESAEKYAALAPVLDLLGKRYGADASDINALVKAIEADDSYYEDEALERGITVEQLKEIKKMERENADLKKQIASRRAEEEASKIYGEWIEQAERAKAKYPSLNLNEEIQNPQFASLLKSGIDVETAFTVIHKDEIIPAAMGFAAKQAEEKTVNKILANGVRPSENGINSQAAAVLTNDVARMTKEQRAEIAERVRRGEIIRF